MNRQLTFLLGAFVMTMGSVAEARVDPLIQRMRSQLSTVHDYRCDLRLDASLPGFSVTNMRMTLYYKRPGKIHIAAKEGFALLPKEGLFLGDPVDEVLQRFELNPLGDARWDGVLCAKYALRPRQDFGSPMGSLRLYVDRERALPVAITGKGQEGSELQTVFEYRRFPGGHWLPVKTALRVRGLPAPGNRPGEKSRADGNATLIFSNHAINTGLPDSIFQRPAVPAGGKR